MIPCLLYTSTPTFEDKGIDLKWPWIDFINAAHKNGVKVLAAITGNVRDGGNTAFYVDLFGDSQKMRAAAVAIAKFVDKYNLDGINTVSYTHLSFHYLQKRATRRA